jgi:isopentenyl diphosphate isomerase/L-lactate dehydrogenase-like FMN-dependent dehydrogenase
MASRSPTTTARQLDRAPIPFHLLPEIVREVGKDTEVHLDTGIMSGADIVASIAPARGSRSPVAPTSTG